MLQADMAPALLKKLRLLIESTDFPFLEREFF
jgi:hypothetical protein